MIKLLKRIWNFRYRAVFYENGRLCWRVKENNWMVGDVVQTHESNPRGGGATYDVVKCGTDKDIKLNNGLYAVKKDLNKN